MKFEARNAKLETNSNHRSKKFKHGRKGGWAISSLDFGLVSDPVLPISNSPRFHIKNHAVYRQAKQSAEITL